MMSQSKILSLADSSNHARPTDSATDPSRKDVTKTAKHKRLVYTLLALSIFLVVVEGLSYVMIAFVPVSAPVRTVKIYKDQSALIRSFIDPSARLHGVMHPVLGWCSKTSFRSATYNSNSQALRGVREYSPAPGPDVLRVAAFGSSIVECSEVDDANSWPALIESANPDMEVLNYGVAGYGSDQAYLRYLAEGKQLAPKVVLLGFTSDAIKARNSSRAFGSSPMARCR
jgi:hypothetical protein